MEVSKNRIRVLFVCVHNSARSQMAGAFLNTLGGDRFTASSAGLEPGKLHPPAVEVMKEIGIDISRSSTKSVFDVYKSGALFSYILAVCDAEAAQRCPTFPGITRTFLWSFPDPASFTGTWEERLARTREVRDVIKARIEKFIEDEEKGVHPALDFSMKTDKDK
jgi:arsenate reductase (thioredoxin)